MSAWLHKTWRMILSLPLWVQGLLIGLMLFAIFNALYHIIEERNFSEATEATLSQQQKWCREFATRTDCNVVRHDNIECPYKNVPNTFKVLNVSSCQNFPAEYEQLQKKLAEHRANHNASTPAARFEVDFIKRTEPEN